MRQSPAAESHRSAKHTRSVTKDEHVLRAVADSQQVRDQELRRQTADNRHLATTVGRALRVENQITEVDDGGVFNQQLISWTVGPEMHPGGIEPGGDARNPQNIV